MEKLLPQNIEAECGVLGSIIIDPEAIVQVSDFLQPEDFYRDAHRTIYEVILHLYQSGGPADFITICDELERRNRLDDVGGASYITSLINQVPTSGNVEYYGHIVERTSTLRRLIHAAGQIAAVAYEEGNADVALDKAERLIFEISQRHSRSDFSPMEEILAAYMTKLEQLNARRGSIIGVPTGFTDLDRMTGGLQRSDLIILAARPGVGKCLTAHTLIDDPASGERLSIEECVQRRLRSVYGISEYGIIRQTEVRAWIDSGVQSCYRVRTCMGREVEVTGHHPFLTMQGWTPLHALNVGDRIAIPRQVPTFGNDESWSLEKVRLLAYFLAEGGLTHNSPVFTNTDPVILADFQKSISALFPVCAIRQEESSYTVVQPEVESKRPTQAKSGKNPVKLWLTELGLFGKVAREKFFPACVWRWDRSRLAEFLRALMSCAGSIFVTDKHYPHVEFSVASRQLAADVQHAFVRFGILSKFYQTSKGAWCVQITSVPDLKKYQEEIGWIGEKVGRFADYTIQEAPRLSNPGHMPQAVWTFMKEAVRLRNLTLIELACQSGETTKRERYAAYTALSPYRTAAYADVLDHDGLCLLSSSDIYWDTVSAIEPLGEQQVYDLTVPDGNNFIAQDIFVHNTSLALSAAHNAAVKYKHSVAVFSLEMSKEQLAQRLLSMDAGIDQQRMRTGWIEEDEWDRIVHASDTLSEANIWIDDTAGISTMEMRSKARRLQAEHGIDMIIVDYLQLMQASSSGRNDNRVQEVSEISRSLKGLARELNVPVLALAQLSRSVESRQSKVPQLSDLRESGCITGDSLVYLPDTGTCKPIAQLVGQKRFRVLALNTETWQLEPREVTNAFATGRKPVYRLTTRLGRSICATANHKFLTIQGWQRLDQLTTEMHLALPRRLPGPTQATMSDEELALPGHLIGAGRSLPTHVLQYTAHELELAEMKADVEFFLAQSGALSQKEMIHQEALSDDLSQRPANTRQDIIPEEAWCLDALPEMQAASLAARTTQASSGNAYCGIEISKQNLSQERAGRLAAVVTEEQIAPLAQSQVYWDQIQSIEAVGEEEVYDLTVDGLHNFIVHGFIAHNSIEQDSDIVLFIYREDVYNPESERKNIANLILAKHRNGPVGEISLYFQPNQTRFRDLEATPTEE